MNIVNPNLNFLELNQLFNKQHNFITIPNFLKEDYALDLIKNIKNNQKDDLMISLHPYQINQYTFNIKDVDNDFINQGIKCVNEAYQRGEFGYCFYRKEKHNDNCDCKMCDFMTKMNSPEMFKLLTQIVTEVKSLVSIFLSCYKEGSFLSTHSDTGRGKIAFVYNLTQDWKEEYGGNFELLTNDWHTVKYKVVPTFNSLTLFNVADDGVPHRVVPVIKNEVERFAISGWFC